MRLTWRCAAIASLLMVIGSIASAREPFRLDDGRGGMTCYYYAVGPRLAWSSPGGDWEDQSGTAYGDRPFAVADVASAKGLQRVEWDLSALVAKWGENGRAGRMLPGAVFLRTMPGSARGVVNFFSREHSDPATRPELLVEWDDGSRERLSPSADAYLSCPSYRGTGAKPVFKVGDGNPAVLAFPTESRRGRRITRARLTLWTDKQYRGGGAIGVFLPTPPTTRFSGVRTGIAAGYSKDANIERHPDVIFTDRFDKPSEPAAWSGMDATGSAEIVTQDRGKGFEALDGKALRVIIPEGKNQGLNIHYRFADHGGAEPEEAYFRYYLRLSDDWDPKAGGKLPGFSGTYGRAGWGGRPADGKNGWSARGSFFAASEFSSPMSPLRGIGSYIYHADKAGEYGDRLGWNVGPTGMLGKNRWYSVEQYVKLNRPGESDGIIRAWIDGVLVFEKTGLRYRDVPDLRIESVWMNVYHGGTTPAPRDLTLYIDNVVIARNYIGPFADGR